MLTNTTNIPQIPSIHSATSNDPIDICAIFLTALSLLLLLATFPISLFLCIKVVQEYERVVIFRLGRLLKGGARGPGIFFVIPCIDTYCKVDLRTVSFDVPPQEVSIPRIRIEIYKPKPIANSRIKH